MPESQSHDLNPSAAHAPAEGGSPAAESTPIMMSSLAIAAITLGVIGLVLPGAGIAALILGLAAINRIDNPANRLHGRGLASAGAITGGVGIVTTTGFVLAALLLPLTEQNRRDARQVQNSAQQHKVQRGMVTYAQGNKTGGGRGYFPGLNSRGELADSAVAERFETMLESHLFTPEYIINPNDTEKQVWSGEGPFTSNHYSYAMLDISKADSGRRDEWSETLNTQAVVLTDRDVNEGDIGEPRSVWTEEAGQWQGTVTRNDNSTTFETTHVIQDTQYGSGDLNAEDDLFEAEGPDDALMIHED